MAQPFLSPRLTARSVLAALAILAGSSLAAAPARSAGATLALIAYSTPQTAYGQIITAFGTTKAGKDVQFTQSYGASGDQARQDPALV